MDTETQGPIAVLKLPKSNKLLSACAKRVSAGMAGNPLLSNPTVSYASLNALIAALDASETGMGGGRAKTNQRNTDRLALVRALGHERDFVQGVANQQTTAAAAATVITSAAMYVRKTGKRNKAPLAAKHAGISGSVLLLALAVAASGAYYWQWSLNQKDWTSVTDTKKAQTTIAGLVPGTTYYFRFRALIATGPTDWSQAVSFMVQ